MPNAVACDIFKFLFDRRLFLGIIPEFSAIFAISAFSRK